MYYARIYVCTVYVFMYVLMYVLCMYSFIYYVRIYVCTMYVRMSEYQEQSCVNSAVTNYSLLPHVITVTVYQLSLSHSNITRVNATKLRRPRLEIIVECMLIPCSVANIQLSKQSIACIFRVDKKTYVRFSGIVVMFLQEKGIVSSQITINFKNIFMRI